MKKILNKNFWLLISTLLLVVVLVCTATLSWFINNSHAKIKNITGKTVSFNFTTEGKYNEAVTASLNDITYITRNGYGADAIGPGCIAYYTFNISTENSDLDATYSVCIDFSKSVLPDDLQFYKGNFSTSDTSLPSDGNSKWSASSYITRSTDNYVCKNVLLQKKSTVEFNLAFFWPYLSSSNSSAVNSNDLLFSRGTKNFKLVFDVNGFSV